MCFDAVGWAAGQAFGLEIPAVASWEVLPRTTYLADCSRYVGGLYTVSHCVCFKFAGVCFCQELAKLDGISLSVLQAVYLSDERSAI